MGEFRKTLVSGFLLFLALLPLIVSAEETCDPEEGGSAADRAEALKYKIAAIISILVAGIFGVCLPIVGGRYSILSPESNLFFFIKAFAAGVILATGFVHILPDATGDLTSPCLGEEPPWGDFPVAGVIAMAAAILTLMFESFAAGYFQRSHSGEEFALPMVDGGGKKALEHGGHEGHIHVTHGHSHCPAFDPSREINSFRHNLVTKVLEVGIVVHSVIIGLSLGASQSLDTIRPLLIAITFHQLFEGLGLGGCIAQAKFKNMTTAMMVIFFSLTTPVGIGIGIGVSGSYNENSPRALIVSGVLNAAAAGILIYMALVDLLATEFMNPNVQSKLKMQIGCSVSLLLGAASMSLLAIWA